MERTSKRTASPRKRVSRRAAPDPAVKAPSFDLERWIESRRELVEAGLVGAVRAMAAPEPLNEAIRYATLSPGKRLRPVMLLAAAEAVANPKGIDERAGGERGAGSPPGGRRADQGRTNVSDPAAFVRLLFQAWEHETGPFQAKGR